jgi:predicted site-specific integrase-resolvase
LANTDSTPLQIVLLALGVHYFSIYRLIQRGKLKTCRALRGKLLVPRTELIKLLQTDLR